MKLLFRAYASSTYKTHTVSPIEDVMVFFESEGRDAVEKLQQLLSLVWSVPEDTIDIYNLCREAELHQQSLSESKAKINTPEWDLHLMETGWSHNQPRYQEELPVLLVAPQIQHRLMQAFMLGASKMADIGRVATCRGCGCDDNHACINAETKQPCHWLTVDRLAGTGICSECAALLHNGEVPHA